MLVWLIVRQFAVISLVHTHYSRRNRLEMGTPAAAFPHIGEP